LNSLLILTNDITILSLTLPSYVFYIMIACVIILAGILASILYKKNLKNKRSRLQSKIDALDENRNKLLASTIEVKLAKVRAFEQTERIATKYKEWLQSWQTIRNTLEKEITAGIIELTDTLERNKFTHFPILEENMVKVISEQTEQVGQLEEVITTFVANEESVQKLYETVKDALKQVAQLFYANKTSLEPYVNQLQVRIEDLDKELQSKLILTDTETKAVVEEQLNKLKTGIYEEYTIIKELPNAIALNSKVLQPQLLILEKAYKEMIDQKFLFQGLNLDNRIEKLKDRVRVIQEQIDRFELKTIEASGVYIRKQIEEIHQILVNEKNAKVDADETIEKLKQKMNKLRFEKEDFLDEWNKVLKRYEITKEQINSVDAFSAQVLSAETKMILYNNQFEKNQEAYVVLLSDLKAFDQYLNELTFILTKLNKQLESTKEDEVYIRAQYKQLKYMHHRSKRKVSQIPSELLSDEYLLKNDEAVLSLQDIETNLQLEVLDVNRLTELIEIAQHLSIRFYKDTNMLIKTAAFAEKAIIYSNRYRFDKEVQRNMTKAGYLYKQGEYTDALDIALSTLETVEPGIYDVLFSAYENAVQKESDK